MTTGTAPATAQNPATATAEAPHRGKVALVTGAARGIGLACARLLAGGGASVAIVDLSGATDTAEALAAEFSGRPEMPGSGAGASGPDGSASAPRFLGFDLDVRDTAAVTAAVDRVVAELGPLDILVNNAGTAARVGLEDMTAELWERDLSTNLGGTFAFTKAAIHPHMARQRSGSIINISSISGINGGAVSNGEAGARSGPAYAASKGGIIALTKWVAKEVGHLGIRCNSVAPGPVESALTVGQDYDLSGQAIGRMGVPEDIASAVGWLASDGAGFVTGQVIRVDGGAVMA